MKPIFGAWLFPLTLVACAPQAKGPTAGPFDSAVNSAGALHVPANYRKTFQYLGTWSVADDGNNAQGAKQLHIVYASPGAVEAHRKTGHFPDGAVLVKEVFAASTATMTTGLVSHAGALQGWFVMVKDGAKAHPGKALWGDGWGWSWFDAATPTKTTSTNYKTDCLTCHQPAAANDWTYVEGYPVLAK